MHTNQQCFQLWVLSNCLLVSAVIKLRFSLKDMIVLPAGYS